MSLGYPSVRVSTATRAKHQSLDPDRSKSPIPQLIWNDGHGEWSRAWYYFKDKSFYEHIINGYYIGFKY